MARRGLIDQDAWDAPRIAAAFSLIILASLAQLAGAILLIGVFVVGFLMIFDHHYLTLFDQWLVAVILYIVYRVALLTRRKTAPAVVVVMMQPAAATGDDDDDAVPSLCRLPSNTRDQPRLPLPRLTLIGHGR